MILAISQGSRLFLSLINNGNVPFCNKLSMTDTNEIYYVSPCEASKQSGIMMYDPLS